MPPRRIRYATYRPRTRSWQRCPPFPKTKVIPIGTWADAHRPLLSHDGKPLNCSTQLVYKSIKAMTGVTLEPQATVAPSGFGCLASTSHSIERRRFLSSAVSTAIGLLASGTRTSRAQADSSALLAVAYE